MAKKYSTGVDQSSEKTSDTPRVDAVKSTSLTLEMTINIVKTAIRTVLDRNRTPYVYKHRSGSKIYPAIDTNPPPAANAIEITACLENGTLSMNEYDLIQVILEVEDTLETMKLLTRQKTLQHLDQLPLTMTVGELASKVFSSVTGQSLSGTIHLRRKRA